LIYFTDQNDFVHQPLHTIEATATLGQAAVTITPGTPIPVTPNASFKINSNTPSTFAIHVRIPGLV